MIQKETQKSTTIETIVTGKGISRHGGQPTGSGIISFVYPVSGAGNRSVVMKTSIVWPFAIAAERFFSLRLLIHANPTGKVLLTNQKRILFIALNRFQAKLRAMN